MIEAIETDLPEARHVDILQWMTRVEAEGFLGALKAESAAIIARAMRMSLETPHRVIATPQFIGPASEELLREAARLQICIDVFEEKRSGDEKMISVTLKTL